MDGQPMDGLFFMLTLLESTMTNFGYSNTVGKLSERIRSKLCEKKMGRCLDDGLANTHEIAAISALVDDIIFLQILLRWFCVLRQLWRLLSPLSKFYNFYNFIIV